MRRWMRVMLHPSILLYQTTIPYVANIFNKYTLRIRPSPRNTFTSKNLVKDRSHYLITNSREIKKKKKKGQTHSSSSSGNPPSQIFRFFVFNPAGLRFRNLFCLFRFDGFWLVGWLVGWLAISVPRTFTHPSLSTSQPCNPTSHTTRKFIYLLHPYI